MLFSTTVFGGNDFVASKNILLVKHQQTRIVVVTITITMIVVITINSVLTMEMVTTTILVC